MAGKVKARPQARDHELTGSERQKGCRAQSFGPHSVMGEDRGAIENRDPAARPGSAALPEKGIAGIPKPQETEPAAVFGEKIDVEIPRRLLGGPRDETAADLVLVIGAQAEPLAADHPFLEKETQAMGPLSPAIGDDLR